LLVFIEEDTVSDTAGITREEFEVPYLRSRPKPLQSLWISEPMHEFVLAHATDARLELFDVWLMPTRSYEETKKGQG